LFYKVDRNLKVDELVVKGNEVKFDERNVEECTLMDFRQEM